VSVPAAESCRLYLISPERIEHPGLFANDLRAALDGGDVAAFQLRLKGVDDDAIARAADTLRPGFPPPGLSSLDSPQFGRETPIGTTWRSSRATAGD